MCNQFKLVSNPPEANSALTLLDQIETLYSSNPIQAARELLTDLNSYLFDSTQLNPLKRRLFEQAGTHLKDKVVQVLKKGNECNPSLKKEQTYQEIQDLRKFITEQADSERLLEHVNEYYQIMAHKAAYANWKKGDRLPGPTSIHPDYLVSDIITNDRGLQIVVLVPDTSVKGLLNSPPIITCRGTANFENLIDDFSEVIGMRGLAPSLKQVEGSLRKIAEEYGPSVLCGHSLGGTITQILTSKFCDQTLSNGKTPWIQACFHYNSPGCGHDFAAEYQMKKALLPTLRQPTVISFHHEMDIGFRAGGPHLEANQEKIVKNHQHQSHLIKEIWDAHSDLALEKNRQKQSILVNHHVTTQEDVWSHMIEGLRSTAGKVAKVAANTLFSNKQIADLGRQILQTAI